MEKETMEKNNLTEKKLDKSHSSRKSLSMLSVVFFLVAGAVALVYLWKANERIYVEKCQIEADSIGLSSTTGGRLNAIYVANGDTVSAGTPVAQVGNDIVKSKLAGTILSAPSVIGANFAPDQTVVTMINPSDLRLDAQVEEDKGLSDISVGQKVIFTVDAFGGKQFYGIVDSISPTARTSDVVFNISSQREEQNFDIKIRFDSASYPEFKNGMSGKAWIYRD